MMLPRIERRTLIGAKPFQPAPAEGWKTLDGPILLGLSELDLTAKAFLEHARTSPHWCGLLNGQNVTRIDIAAAEHTLRIDSCA